jgi:hypothetical protein
MLHSAGSGGRGSWPDWYCEIGFEEIAVDLPQARLWVTSGLPTNLGESSDGDDGLLWAYITARGCRWYLTGI